MALTSHGQSPLVFLTVQVAGCLVVGLFGCWVIRLLDCLVVGLFGCLVVCWVVGLSGSQVSWVWGGWGVGWLDYRVCWWCLVLTGQPSGGRGSGSGGTQRSQGGSTFSDRRQQPPRSGARRPSEPSSPDKPPCNTNKYIH